MIKKKIEKLLESKEYDSTKDTKEHIEKVRSNLSVVISELTSRAEKHDATKLESPEKEIFDRHSENLRLLKYGSKEYKKELSEMKPGLDHHYASNSHHPEFYKNGIKDMDLVDIIEMICDWKAAAERYKNGDVLESIEANQKRFGYSDDLKQIFINTIKKLK